MVIALHHVTISVDAEAPLSMGYAVFKLNSTAIIGHSLCLVCLQVRFGIIDTRSSFGLDAGATAHIAGKIRGAIHRATICRSSGE